jgi:hypothetical protein
MTFASTKLRFILIIPLLFFLASCYPSKKLTVISTATLLEDVVAASYRQSNLRVIRDGMPAYLMLIDGMIEAWPDNERILLAAAQANSAYASIFLEEDEKAYALHLQGKAMNYALKAFELTAFKNPRTSSFEEFEKELSRLNRKHVPYLFWAAACWGSWISLNLSSMEAQAELPRVEMMMKRVLVLDESFHHGGPHLFMGIWFASRPKIAGGNLDTARQHFLKAIELGQGKFLMAKIYYAEYYAKKTFDQELFTSTLNDVLDTPVDIYPELTLMNSVAHRKAQEMLKDAEDYF